jgi:hypothetical protein
VQRLADAPHTMLPPSLGKLWQNRDLIGSLLKVGRKHVRNAHHSTMGTAPSTGARLPEQHAPAQQVQQALGQLLAIQVWWTVPTLLEPPMHSL